MRGQVEGMPLLLLKHLQSRRRPRRANEILGAGARADYGPGAGCRSEVWADLPRESISR